MKLDKRYFLKKHFSSERLAISLELILTAFLITTSPVLLIMLVGLGLLHGSLTDNFFMIFSAAPYLFTHPLFWILLLFAREKIEEGNYYTSCKYSLIGNIGFLAVFVYAYLKALENFDGAQALALLLILLLSFLGVLLYIYFDRRPRHSQSKKDFEAAQK